MKNISHEGNISSIRALSDGSVSYTMHTPSLPVMDKAMLMEYQNLALQVALVPIDEAPKDTYEIQGSVDLKSPSERQRNILYAIWKQKDTEESFEKYYLSMMNKIAESLKRNYLV